MTRERWLAVAGLAAVVGGFLVAVVAGLENGDSGVNGAVAAPTQPPTEATAPTPKPKPKPNPKLARVPLQGLRGYDPEGDGRERDETAALAADGNASTYWESENYTSFFKDGVGLLLDAGRAVTLTRVVVTTPRPGVSASIRVGNSPEGPFTEVAAVKRLGATTTFAVRRRPARYVVVWIEAIPNGGTARIGEVRAWRAGATS